MTGLLTLAAGLIMTTSGAPGLLTCGIKDVTSIEDGGGSSRILFSCQATASLTR